MAKVDIKIDPKTKTLAMNIDWSGDVSDTNAKIGVYGGIMLAEEQASIYFMQKQFQEAQVKQATGVIGPDGKPVVKTPLGVA